jgi:hypothetical protein
MWRAIDVCGADQIFCWQRHLIVILGKFSISGIGKKISNRLNVALQNQPTRHRCNPRHDAEGAQADRYQTGRVGHRRPLNQNRGTQPLYQRRTHDCRRFPTHTQFFKMIRMPARFPARTQISQGTPKFPAQRDRLAACGWVA